MTCPDCVKAKLGPWPLYTAGCTACQARMLAVLKSAAEGAVLVLKSLEAT